MSLDLHASADTWAGLYGLALLGLAKLLTPPLFPLPLPAPAPRSCL